MTKSWVIFGLCPPPQRFFVCARIVCLCKVISVGEKIQWWILQLFCNATVKWREMTGNLWPIVCTQRLVQLSLIRSMNHPLIHFELQYTRPTFWNQFEELSNNYILLNFSIAYKENVQWDIMSLKVSMFPRKRFSWKNNDHELNGSTINLNKNSTWMIWCTAHGQLLFRYWDCIILIHSEVHSIEIEFMHTSSETHLNWKKRCKHSKNGVLFENPPQLFVHEKGVGFRF